MGEFVPLYRQVSQQIMRSIYQGVYKYGDKIPSEKELVAHYQVNRMTVRRAIGLLAEQGVLKSVQGKGVFVTDTFFQVGLPENSIMFDKAFFTDERLHSEVLFLEDVPAGKLLGDMFRVSPDAGLWLLGRRWMAEKMALVLEYTYIPKELAPDLTKGCSPEWESFLARKGITGRLEQTVKGIPIFGEEAELLQIADGENAFLVMQRLMADDQRAMRFTKILAHPRKIIHYIKKEV